VADVLLLFAAALCVLGGGAALVLIVRSGRRRRELERHQRPRRLQAELDEISQRIRRIDQAATDAELDRLEHDKEQ